MRSTRESQKEWVNGDRAKQGWATEGEASIRSSGRRGWRRNVGAVLYALAFVGLGALSADAQDAELLYIRFAGDVYLDGRSAVAPIWAFALETDPEGPGFLSDAFESPFGNLISEQTANLKFIGDFDQGDAGLEFLALGRVFPPDLDDSTALADFLRAASYLTIADLESEMERMFQPKVVQLGDLDTDRDVDSADLGLFLAGWTGALDTPSDSADYTTGDLDFDFDVDSADLGEFLAAWTGSLDAGRRSVVNVPEPSSLFLGTVALLVTAGLVRAGEYRVVRHRRKQSASPS